MQKLNEVGYRSSLTYFANSCCKDTLMSVPGDIEVEAPLIYSLIRRKIEGKEGLLSSAVNPTDIYGF